MHLNKKWILGILISSFIVSAGFLSGLSDHYFQIAKNMEIFAQVYKEINTAYVDEPNPTRLMREGLDEMLSTLDPYTNYYSESEIENAKFYQAGQYSSIGVELIQIEDKVLIEDIRQGSNAAKAGFKIGDEVTHIDASPVTGLSMDEIQSRIQGESGSQLQLKIQRVGTSAPLILSAERKSLREKNVPFFSMANEQVGYIKLTGFEQDAGLEVSQALQLLKSRHPSMQAVMLDLRGNPGGRVDEAVKVSNTFLPKDETIVFMRGRDPSTQRSFSTPGDAVDTKIPVAVLMNRSSASASEIVAGSIQDFDRGIIVGERSFGKGLVQNVRPLTDNTQLKITIAKYYTPSGRCIQAIDYSARNEDGSVGKIADSLKHEFLTKNGRKVYDGGGIEPDLTVTNAAQPAVIRALLKQRLIFDFATQYLSMHDSIPPAKEFYIEEKTYQAFIAFLETRDFSYQTNSERRLKQWQATLDSMEYESATQQAISQFQAKLKRQKEQDIMQNQKSISRLLRTEIIRRYYYQDGILEASFGDDPVVLAAISRLLNPAQYQALLTP